VAQLVRVLAKAGIEVWLDGGWAVDALLGEQTRSHDDVDIVVRDSDLPRLLAVLATLVVFNSCVLRSGEWV